MWLGRGGGGGDYSALVLLSLIHPSPGGIGLFCQVRILLVRWLLWDEIWKGKGEGKRRGGRVDF